LVVLAGVPYGWTRMAASGHIYGETDLSGGSGGSGGSGVDGAAPTADVVLVLGAQVAPGGGQPMPFLRSRLDTAAHLVREGRAKVILVSGDSRGDSGNETAVMVSYLTGVGIEPGRIVADPYGLDTYDSCVRAAEVYGVTRALVVTQSFHLARAVALCRHAGMDADGIGARCDGCRTVTLVRNWGRDYFACSKAALDVLGGSRPAVESSANNAVTEALARLTR
jgi:vancomycin permeability regulator SanA